MLFNRDAHEKQPAFHPPKILFFVDPLPKRLTRTLPFFQKLTPFSTKIRRIFHHRREPLSHRSVFEAAQLASAKQVEILRCWTWLGLFSSGGSSVWFQAPTAERLTSGLKNSRQKWSMQAAACHSQGMAHMACCVFAAKVVSYTAWLFCH